MNLTTAFSRFAYWPGCRFYAKHFVGDRPADTILAALSMLEYRMRLGRWPNLRQPSRFSEKLWCRLLHARDPVLTVLSDKLLVRDYVAERVGREYLVPLLWTGRDARAIPFDALPSCFVLKANHGCGYTLVVREKSDVDRPRMVRRAQRWLATNFGDDAYLGISWGYRHVIPALLVEELLEENQGPPVDYKFYCFSGRVEFVTLHFDRFGQHRMRAVGRSFEPYEVSTGRGSWTGDFARPLQFDRMVQIAEALAAAFNFMRIDLYCPDDRIYVGEITPYPKGTAPTIYPASRDAYLGTLWQGSASLVSRP